MPVNEIVLPDTPVLVVVSIRLPTAVTEVVPLLGLLIGFKIREVACWGGGADVVKDHVFGGKVILIPLELCTSVLIAAL